MSVAEIYKALQWRSRRGMLELDILLEPFTRDVYGLLSKDDQDTYIRLLDSEDPDLLNWFMNGTRPTDVKMSMMIDKVLQSSCNKIGDM